MRGFNRVTNQLPHERASTLGEQVLTKSILTFLTLLAWLVTIFQLQTMNGSMAMSESMVTPSSISSRGSAFVIFLLMWLPMMVAMMFPSATPMVLSFNRLVQQQKAQGQVLGLTGVFVISYMIPWIIFGIIAELAMLTVQASSQLSSFHLASLIAIPLIAGFYQFTPLKTAFLSHHQTPIDCMSRPWSKGFGGAFSLGIHHGNYCIGSCWGLMLVLLAFGVMKLVAMVLITVIIFAERSAHKGFPVRHKVGVGLMGLGIWTAVQSALAI